MKGDFEERISRRYYRNESQQEKVNSLWSEILEKEEEVKIYKERLKELEIAFSYNLELISERDLELSFLEKQLQVGNEHLQQITEEKNQLEDLLKTFDEKSYRKIQQLETRLSLKDDEIRELQRENMNHLNALERNLEETKKQHQKQIYHLTTKYETHKRELVKEYRQEIEEKENYYLRKLDNVTGQLQEVGELLVKIVRENEKLLKLKEENKSLKHHLAETEKLFQEKENLYLEELKIRSRNDQKKTEKEVQCKMMVQVNDERVQVESAISDAESQTIQNESDLDGYYSRKINFLQEQNEVLKWIIKDLKKNRDVEYKTEEEDQRRECVECRSIKAEIEEVNKKFENEIDNLKKILSDEQKQRAEEETVIQSLETSVSCLKDKLLLELQKKLEDFEGEDICSYTYNREIHNEIKVCLLEQKIDSLITTGEEERKKFEDKLQQLKTDCLKKIEKFRLDHQEPNVIKDENLLEKIRMEIQKLENKIESDMKNIVRNNIETNKCDKNLQTRGEFFEKRETFDPKLVFPVFPVVKPRPCFLEMEKPGELPPSNYFKNDISPEKCLSVHKIETVKFQNELRKKRIGNVRTTGRDFVVGR